MSASQVRQNFHDECEAAINRQINMELYAYYTYLAMVNFTIRSRVKAVMKHYELVMNIF